jgi:hypothetical protein
VNLSTSASSSRAPPLPVGLVYQSLLDDSWDRILIQPMHEFLTENNNSSSYRECIACNKRTPHICLKCNYCYSCHPLIERIEKAEREKQLIKSFKNTIQQPPHQRMTSVSFVMYTRTKPRTINERFKPFAC